MFPGDMRSEYQRALAANYLKQHGFSFMQEFRSYLINDDDTYQSVFYTGHHFTNQKRGVRIYVLVDFENSNSPYWGDVVGFLCGVRTIDEHNSNQCTRLLAIVILSLMLLNQPVN